MADKPKVVMDPSATFRRLVPVDRLASPVTPSDDVYVIAHMGIARVDVKQWRLTVDGLVERPFELDYEALPSLPATDITAVLECFGNPVEPEVATRRVGNVVWRGVRLSHLLERAGVRPEARLVCPEGLDSGSFANVHSERYVKDLPLARALEPDVLVAWAMNGEPLSAEHGFPARVFVPGYFGTNAVKWLLAHHARGRASREPVHHEALQPARRGRHAPGARAGRARGDRGAGRGYRAGARPAHDRGLGVERLAGERGGGQRRRRQDVAAGARGAARRRSPVAGVQVRVGRFGPRPP